jgi:hypothetical protein
MQPIRPESASAELQISDLQIAAFIAASGFAPHTLSGPLNGRVSFHFRDVPQSVVDGFEQPTQVVAQKLFKSYLDLRRQAMALTGRAR